MRINVQHLLSRTLELITVTQKMNESVHMQTASMQHRNLLMNGVLNYNINARSSSCLQPMLDNTLVILNEITPVNAVYGIRKWKVTASHRAKTAPLTYCRTCQCKCSMRSNTIKQLVSLVRSRKRMNGENCTQHKCFSFPLCKYKFALILLEL